MHERLFPGANGPSVRVASYKEALVAAERSCSREALRLSKSNFRGTRTAHRDARDGHFGRIDGIRHRSPIEGFIERAFCRASIEGVAVSFGRDDEARDFNARTRVV